MKKLIITLLIIFPSIALGFTFNRALKVNMQGNDVLELQKILKQEFSSYKNDWMTGYFGNITKSYVIQLQEKYSDQILKPFNLSRGTGYVGNSTIDFLNDYISGEVEGLDIQCIPSKDKVKIGDNVMFYILKNSGNEPFTHYWGNTLGDFYKQVTINSASDTQIPVTVIDANNNKSTVVCSVTLDEIKYSTVDKVVDVSEIESQNNTTVATTKKENKPLILSCDSDEFKYLEFYKDKIFIPENSFLGKVYRSCEYADYFEADPVLLKSFVSYVQVNTSHSIGSSNIILGGDKIDINLVSITPCRMFVMDNQSFINNRSYGYNYVAPVCTDDYYYIDGKVKISCDDSLRNRAKTVNNYYYVVRLCLRNDGKADTGNISFSYLDYNNKGLRWKIVDNMEHITYVNEHDTVNLKHKINNCYENKRLSSQGKAFMLKTEYSWIENIKPGDKECVNLILVQDGDPLKSADFQKKEDSKFSAFNNCSDDLKGELLYNMGFSSDKIDKSKLYQDKYIRSGISIPESSKFLCVVGNNNILEGGKQSEDPGPIPPKLRPCWVKGHSSAIKAWLDSLLNEHISNSIGEDSDISASEIRSEYYENVYPRYYDACVVEYKYSCKGDFFTKTLCEEDGFEIFNEMSEEEYAEIIEAQGK